MNPKQLIVLASLLVVAVIIALVLPRDDDKKAEDGLTAGDKVFSELPVNDVEQLSITGDENSVELERSGEKWVVKSRGGYSADFTKLRNVLTKLRDLKVADSVRAGESAYGRLEIKDPAGEADEKAGTLVVLKKGDGSELASMVLGKNYEGASDGTGGPGRGSGRYLRDRSDKDKVYIVSEAFYELDPNPSSWLLRDFFRVQKHRTVDITHPEGEVYKFSREEEGGELKFEGLADDEELNTTNTGTIGSAFSSASFRDVASGDAGKPEETGLDNPVKVEISTFDGFRYVVNLGKKVDENTESDEASATLNDTKYFLTVEVEADLPETREPQEDETVAGDASDEDKQKAEDLKKTRDEEFAAQQKTLKEKLEKEKAYAGTVYEIDSWTAEKFFKKRDELVKKKEEPAEGGETPPAGGASLAPGGEGRPPIVATTPPISLADALKNTEEGESGEEQAAPEGEGGESDIKPSPEGGQPDEGADPEGENAPEEAAADPSEAEVTPSTEVGEDGEEASPESGDSTTDGGQ